MPEWRPPKYMTKDTLVIPSLVNRGEIERVIRSVNNMILSQYDAVR